MGNGDEPRGQVTVQEKRNDIRSLLSGDSLKHEIKLALPKICTIDRFLRVALTAVNKNPRLLDCTRESLVACLYGCAELGLEPDGRRAHLIPYGDKCTLIIDYKGKAELALRSGTVSNIHADKICENDVFEFDKGEIKKHTVDFRKERGSAYAYYCLVRMKDGTEKAEVMTVDEIYSIRDRSSAWKRFKKDGTTCPWNTDEGEMAKKTVFHRVSKWVTLSPELRRAEELDDDRLDPTMEVHIPEKDFVPAPRSKSDSTNPPAASECSTTEKGAHQIEFEELKDLSTKANKKVQTAIHAHLEAFCAAKNKTVDEFTEADFEAVLPGMRNALK